MLQLGWKNVLAVRNHGIAQAVVSTAAYSTALGKGFPSVSALLQQERASLAKLLQLDSDAQECSNYKGRFPQPKSYSPGLL